MKPTKEWSWNVGDLDNASKETHLQGNTYRDAIEIPGPSKWYTRWCNMKEFVSDHAWLIGTLSIVFLFIGLIIYLCHLDSEADKKANNTALIFLNKNNYTNIMLAYVYTPSSGFATGSGCLGKKFEVNFSATSPDNKYMEGAVCCSNENDCRFNKYYSK